MVKIVENKNINEFIDKIVSENNPVAQKKIKVNNIDIPRKRKITKPQETGFVCNEFEIILDAEQD